jgi:hypothetical protein
VSANRKSIAMAVCLTVLLSSRAAAGVIYQWTENGVVHFTDSLSLVPDAARKSSSFIVRKDLDTSGFYVTQVQQVSSEALVEPEAARVAEPMQAPSEPIMTVYAPQEVTIVVVNSDSRHLRKDPCKFGHCAPAFRPDFNSRQYIHPSVFNGGSQQYIQPRLFNPTPRHHIPRR